MFLSKHNKPTIYVVTGKMYAVPIGGIVADRMWQIAIVVIDILSQYRRVRAAHFYFVQ